MALKEGLAPTASIERTAANEGTINDEYKRIAVISSDGIGKEVVA